MTKNPIQFLRFTPPAFRTREHASQRRDTKRRWATGIPRRGEAAARETRAGRRRQAGSPGLQLLRGSQGQAEGPIRAAARGPSLPRLVSLQGGHTERPSAIRTGSGELPCGAWGGCPQLSTSFLPVGHSLFPQTPFTKLVLMPQRPHVRLGCLSVQLSRSSRVTARARGQRSVDRVLTLPHNKQESPAQDCQEEAATAQEQEWRGLGDSGGWWGSLA